MRLPVETPELYHRLLELLGSGAVVIMPCDTIYGLVGVAPDTEEKLRQIKGREEKSFLRLIASAGWLGRFTDLPLPQGLAGYWPGPLTIIFPARTEPSGGARERMASTAAAAAPGSSPRPTVALRVPQDPLLLRLMEALDRPLFSTSVNRSGRPPLGRIHEIVRSFEAQVDLVVDAGDRADSLPSTILDVTVRPFRVLRPGAVRLPARLLQSS